MLFLFLFCEQRNIKVSRLLKKKKTWTDTEVQDLWYIYKDEEIQGDFEFSTENETNDLMFNINKMINETRH